MTPADPTSAPRRDHYSYAHYADQSVAEGFDALRFSGDVGRFLLEEQAALLHHALEPSPARRVLDKFAAERGFHRRQLFAGPYQVGRGTAPQEQSDSLDQDGFARARFAGEDVERLFKLDGY